MPTQQQQTDLDAILNHFWWNYIRLGGADLDWFYLYVGPLVKLRYKANLALSGGAGDGKRG